MKSLLSYPASALHYYRNNYQDLLKVSLIIALISLAFDILPQLPVGLFSGPLATSILVLLKLLLTAIFSITLYQIIHNLIHQNHSQIKQILFESKKQYRNFIILNIIYFVIIFAGLILFFIPGIIFAVWYFASAYLIATSQIKPFEALDLSRRAVANKFWPTLSRLLVSIIVFPLPIMVIISVIGSISLPGNFSIIFNIILNFISVLVLTPYMYLVFALIYNDLKTE